MAYSNDIQSDIYDPSLQSYTSHPPSTTPCDDYCSRCYSINFPAINAVNIKNPLTTAVRLAAQSVFSPPSLELDLMQNLRGERDSLIWTVVPVFDLGPSIAPQLETCRLCKFLEAVSRCTKTSRTAAHWYLGVTTIKHKRLYLIGAAPTWETDTAERGEILMAFNHKHDPTIGDSHHVRPKLSIHYQALTTWIGTCIQESSQYTMQNIVSPNDEEILGMKLIDCRTVQVVKAPTTFRYVALSYVWGPQSQSNDIFALLDGTIIKSKLSQTIADAIRITAALGVDYLWVDRYCIDQGDEKVKLKQISQMHRIFQGAWATIVALGADETTGLSGVSSEHQNLSVSTPQCHLQHIGPDVMISHALSQWSSRAWTYQECFLSPRTLSFAPRQVFMVCEHCTLQESFPQKPHPKLQDWVDSGYDVSEFQVPTTKAKLLGTQYGIVLSFQDALHNYTSRSLTYEADSLFAFQGYLSSLETISCLGIPLYKMRRDQKEIMSLAKHQRAKLNGGSVGLAWYEKSTTPTSKPKHTGTFAPNPTTSEQVCKLFPSWSWTSCRPGIKSFSCYNLREDLIDEDALIYSAIEISSENTDGSRVPWSTLERSVFSGTTNVLHLRTRLVPFTIPPQQPPDPFLLTLHSSIFPNLIDLPLFTGIVLPWPIPVSSPPYDLGTSTTTFHPDIRPPCSCHKHLHISPAPESPTPEVQAVAALLCIEKQRLWQQYIVTHWMVLREDSTGLIKRIGLLRVEFDASPIWSGSGSGDEDAAYGWMWRTFEAMVAADLKQEGNVKWVKIC